MQLLQRVRRISAGVIREDGFDVCFDALRERKTGFEPATLTLAR
jgi:hypothetical protein